MKIQNNFFGGKRGKTWLAASLGKHRLVIRAPDAHCRRTKHKNIIVISRISCINTTTSYILRCNLLCHRQHILRQTQNYSCSCFGSWPYPSHPPSISCFGHHNLLTCICPSPQSTPAHPTLCTQENLNSWRKNLSNVFLYWENQRERGESAGLMKSPPAVPLLSSRRFSWKVFF